MNIAFESQGEMFIDSKTERSTGGGPRIKRFRTCIIINIDDRDQIWTNRDFWTVFDEGCRKFSHKWRQRDWDPSTLSVPETSWPMFQFTAILKGEVVCCSQGINKTYWNQWQHVEQWLTLLQFTPNPIWVLTNTRSNGKELECNLDKWEVGLYFWFAVIQWFELRTNIVSLIM